MDKEEEEGEEEASPPSLSIEFSRDDSSFTGGNNSCIFELDFFLISGRLGLGAGITIGPPGLLEKFTGRTSRFVSIFCLFLFDVAVADVLMSMVSFKRLIMCGMEGGGGGGVEEGEDVVVVSGATVGEGSADNGLMVLTSTSISGTADCARAGALVVGA